MDTDGVTVRGEKWSAAGSRGGGLFMHQWPTGEGDGKRSVHITRGLKTVREEEGDNVCGDRAKDQQVNGHSSLHIVNCRNARMAGDEKGGERTSGLLCKMVIKKRAWGDSRIILCRQRGMHVSGSRMKLWSWELYKERVCLLFWTLTLQSPFLSKCLAFILWQLTWELMCPVTNQHLNLPTQLLPAQKLRTSKR